MTNRTFFRKYLDSALKQEDYAEIQALLQVGLAERGTQLSFRKIRFVGLRFANPTYFPFVILAVTARSIWLLTNDFMLKISSLHNMETETALRLSTIAADSHLLESALANFPQQLEITSYPQLDDFLATVHESSYPQLILISQTRCDQYNRSTINQLLDRCPLARFLVVLGPLCAAERRTRNQWPVAWMVPEWAFLQRLQREIEVLSDQRPALPVTASLEEVARFDFESSAPQKHLGEAAIIFSPDAIWAKTMALIKDQSDSSIVCHNPHNLTKTLTDHPELPLIFDLDPLTSDLKVWLKSNRTLIAQRSSLAFCNWRSQRLIENSKAWGFQDCCCKLAPPL